jgi:hypothetical protein
MKVIEGRLYEFKKDFGDIKKGEVISFDDINLEH